MPDFRSEEVILSRNINSQKFERVEVLLSEALTLIEQISRHIPSGNENLLPDLSKLVSQVRAIPKTID
ncbi:hypothetical protein NIES2101_41890 [Calothrix sp. HK-06]|nr:hypothetical protein NIES2101_41890 [Calothrix sp. HK-06]